MSIQPVVTCDQHPASAAVARCLVCGVPLCAECAVEVEGHHVCAAHATDFRLLREQRPPPELPRPDITTRAIAYVTDGVVLFGIGAFMLSIIMALLRPAISFDATILIHVALFTAALAIYTTYFISQQGRTPGQALYHLRVVDAEGGATISVGRAFLRWFGYLISTLTFFYGFLIAAKDRWGQGWPDKLAGTIVVGPSLGGAQKLRAIVTLGILLFLEALYALFTISVR
jgi:uncharacterized RDD family membrane protein YckC